MYSKVISRKETKWTSLEVITDPTFLETFISKYDFGPVKLRGLSRNGPLATILKTNTLVTTGDEFGTCGNLGKERNTK